MSLPSLYTIAQQHRALTTLDVEEIDEKTLLDTLAGLEGDLQVKATSTVAFYKNVQAMADMVKGAADALSTRAQAMQRRADAVKAYIKASLEAGGINKIESPEFTARIQNNPPAVEIFNEDDLPPEYVVTPPAPPPSPSKKLIADALKAGKEVPGARLMQSTRLVISK